MVKPKISDNIGVVHYNKDMMEEAVRIVKEYCTNMSCKECVLRRRGIDACRQDCVYSHPLQDPVYVKQCLQAICEELDEQKNEKEQEE